MLELCKEALLIKMRQKGLDTDDLAQDPVKLIKTLREYCTAYTASEYGIATSVKVMKNFANMRMQKGEEIHHYTTRIQNAIEQLKVKYHVLLKESMPAGYES